MPTNPDVSHLKRKFTYPLMAWFDKHGRHQLPWKYPLDPYRVWLAEVMLQQTQVKTVIPYFERFIACFPNIHALAKADEDDVLALWSGLGYYSRARNLFRAAKIIDAQYAQQFPRTLEALVKLPGIGRSTAAAILSQAFNQPTPILDANVRRVLSRFFRVPGYGVKVEQQLWQLAHDCQSHKRAADYTQGIMDFGALVCTHRNPSCQACPLQKGCMAYQNDDVIAYPQKKKKPPRPVRHYQMPLFCNNHQIYLEKRMSKGIWQGLWCPDLISFEQTVMQFAKQKWGGVIEHFIPFMALQHILTHFELHIEVSLLALPFETRVLDGQWLTLEDALKLGLPKPVRDILQALKKHRETENSFVNQ